VKEGLICQGTEVGEVKGGAGTYPPGNSTPEGGLEAELICFRDVPPPARRSIEKPGNERCTANGGEGAHGQP